MESRFFPRIYGKKIKPWENPYECSHSVEENTVYRNIFRDDEHILRKGFPLTQRDNSLIGRTSSQISYFSIFYEESRLPYRFLSWACANIPSECSASKDFLSGLVVSKDFLVKKVATIARLQLFQSIQWLGRVKDSVKAAHRKKFQRSYRDSASSGKKRKE